MFVWRLAPCFLIIALNVLKAESAPSLSKPVINKDAYGDLPDGKQVDVSPATVALDGPAVMAKAVALKPYVQQDRMPGLLRKADCPDETKFKVNPQIDFAKKRTGKLHTLRFGIFA